ncbi:MAG: alpha-2-macroglobulin family protein, partial [Anaerolineae bacterium]|nr:alpha-2-macroglobulin family protein [Anaerolineae bacterium]
GHPLGGKTGTTNEATDVPAPTPSPLPTALLQPGTATPAALPLESYPFRQLFPETLFWAPEVETDANGSVGVDIPLADSITTWRLTALGSTKDGVIGAASHDLLVFQDFFVEVPSTIDAQVNESTTIMLTVYNFTDIRQTVDWEIESQSDFIVEQAPEILTLPGNAVLSTEMTVVPQHLGQLSINITAIGESMIDRITLNLSVTAP